MEFENVEIKQRSIYFIYTQTKNNIDQIKFKPKDDKFDIKELNLKYDQKNIDNNKNIITIFEISFSLQKESLNFYLEMNTIDKKKFVSKEEYSITKEKDIFIYNLEFKNYEKTQFSIFEQFNFFSQFLKEKNETNSKENLIKETIAILNKNKENFDFDFFLCLFKEIFFTDSLKKLFSIFDVAKIKFNKNFEPKLYENFFIS